MHAEATLNTSVSASDIRNAIRPVPAVMHVLAAQGSRARISRSIPFARTDDPSVAEEGSGHSATNEGEASMLRLDVIRPNSRFRKVEIQPRPIAYVPHQILRGQTG